jgi:hypothetical protein
MKQVAAATLMIVCILCGPSIFSDATARANSASCVGSGSIGSAACARLVAAHNQRAAAHNRGMTAKDQVLPVLRPYIPKLLRSGIPVYLPRWLPSHGRLYPFVSVGPGSYLVELSDNPSTPCHACDRIALDGRKGAFYTPTAFTRPVLLHSGTGFAHGQWAYLDPNPGGNAGVRVYMVHSKPWNRKTPQIVPQQYTYLMANVQFHIVQVARSLVLVNP